MVHAEDWTVNDTTYHNVTVDKVDGNQVHFMYDGGIKTLALTDLPPDVQKRLSAQEAAETPASTGTEAQVKAGPIFTVKVGGTDIKLSNPQDMVEVAKDDPLNKVIKDLMPSDCLLLRSCISSEAYDPVKAQDAETNPMTAVNIMTSQTYALKEVQMDITFGNFIDCVQQISAWVSHGILWSKDSSFDYVETQKRLAQFQKDTGARVKEDTDLFSLGLVSRSDACVAFMTAQYINVTEEGKTKRIQCVSDEAFILLNKKVVLVETSLNKNVVYPEDILALKKAAEKYQIALQILNN